MRIVIDMQGAQTESRFRGIGRYTLSLAQAIVRNRGEHEVLLALNGLFAETIEPLRAAFDGLLPQTQIRVWQAPAPVSDMNPDNTARRETAELLREAFLASLDADVIHVCSFFEGYVDDAVTSIGRFDRRTPVAVTLHDLIPLLNPDHYLKPNPAYQRYYLRKVEQLKSASLFLPVSNSSLQEGKCYLGVADACLFNTSEAVEPRFQRLLIDTENIDRLRTKFALSRAFVLYSGGADERKNLPRLIESYAALPSALRGTHQLLLAGKISQGELLLLQQKAHACGLAPDELLFTGYVSDEELIQLYNLCALFVFPSWHEGFGLPVLEAMACGAAVIAANASSLPEVVGLSEALFDPLDIASMTQKMTQALTDDAFRQRLLEHGLSQAQQFSWDESARRALAAFATLPSRQPHPSAEVVPGARRPKLAFVSPLPPERTGIADYSAELLPALAAHYEIEIVVAQETVSGEWVSQHGPVRTPDWLRAHAGEIDRVVYQMGNSPYHRHMLALLREVPGTLVLHDFYLGSLHAWMESQNGAPPLWSAALQAAHGYAALSERFHAAAPEAVKLKYPVNLELLRHAKGIIVHSAHARALAQRWYGVEPSGPWAVIPLVRAAVAADEGGAVRNAARARLGLAATDFVVCSFGFLDSTKLNHRLLDAWLGSRLMNDPDCRLVFVGENHQGEYGAQLLESIRRAGRQKQVLITGYAAPEAFRDYLAAADLAVQLRTNSRGETSAAALDCLNHGLPTIVNAHGSMAELDADSAWILPDEFSDGELITALETLRHDPARRQRLGQRGRSIIARRHAPPACARAYADAIEAFERHAHAPSLIQALVRDIAARSRSYSRPNHDELRALAQTIAVNLPLPRVKSRLLLDVSATCRNDLKTGIERVARALLLNLLAEPPPGFSVEPVYLSDGRDGGNMSASAPCYRFARRYALSLFDCPTEALSDDVVDPENGDLLLLLDLSGERLVKAQQAGLHAYYRNLGVKVYALVHDLLPVRLPEVFPPGADVAHAEWLEAIAGFDGAICVSRAVADDLSAWRAAHEAAAAPRRPYRIACSHHGADFTHSAPSRGLPADAAHVLAQFTQRPTLLAVGTVEPRKGYLQLLDAFTLLWQAGVDVNLAIVGPEGWKSLPDGMRRNIPETVQCLRGHPERNRRLYWLEGISDEYLEQVYAASSALIAASLGEGFGLPLIEAAQHRRPIIARDLPVFREVAGAHASYFNANSPTELADFLQGWLAQFAAGTHIRSTGLLWLTWQQSATNLKQALAEWDALSPPCS